MKLAALISQYVAYKQNMGMRFNTENRTLKSFCRAMGDIAASEIAADQVHAYIAGTGPVTRFWHRKYEVLLGFYRYAIARGYVECSPLPKSIPKPPEFVPYIFSQEELQRLLDASTCCDNPLCKLQPNTCRNTQCSYRDALILLIPFVARKQHQPVDRLTVLDLSADMVRLFLADLEQSRGCSIPTRNQRLAAIHALARFVGEHSPEHIAWGGQIRSIPFKKASKAVVPYLERPQMDALLSAPDRTTRQGRRDHALLLFLYNSGARAQEAAQLLTSELVKVARSDIVLCGQVQLKNSKLWS